jgi:hypothetical protein
VGNSLSATRGLQDRESSERNGVATPHGGARAPSADPWRQPLSSAVQEPKGASSGGLGAILALACKDACDSDGGRSDLWWGLDTLGTGVMDSAGGRRGEMR